MPKKRGYNKPKRSDRSKKRKGADIELLKSVKTEIVPFTCQITPSKHLPLNCSTADACTRAVRIVRPYPYTFSTFAKKRWEGKSILNVYEKEFGSYPRSYYDAAITSGRITVNHLTVATDYIIKGGDSLSHTVHRHEPAVLLGNLSTVNSNDGKEKLINIIGETDEVLVVDKPPTLPIHPCGGYHLNSLFHVLAAQRPDLQNSLFTVHRLDRLTSGLTIIAKKSDVAKALGESIQNRRECEKMYLARLKGRFPLNFVDSSNVRLQTDNVNIECGVEKTGDCETNKGQEDTGCYDEQHSHEPALALWVTDESGRVCNGASMQDVFISKNSIDTLLFSEDNDNIAADPDSSVPRSHSAAGTCNRSIFWIHLACPCVIASHKDGICKAGSGLGPKAKPAQTSFSVISYDEASDSTVVLVKPETGRTHQIRLHAQYLQHPIANDPNYGGELFFGDANGMVVCDHAKKRLREMDQIADEFEAKRRGEEGCVTAANGGNSSNITCNDRCTSDVPATKEEIEASLRYKREEGESLMEYIEKTCVWCHRSRAGDRHVLELQTRSQGIWLHALQYKIKELQYRTNPPSWSTFHLAKET